ncbi:aromatase/cyclase [Streptomyces sp. NBC_00986]|uniref:aromatase/cyclase n=1 Tax=Streptomyces sp. NBC_00986 TaxID=2903702 RepID=UPI003866DA79|nr:aromatase/cyclase [Streptomyces sp. NBC_00986]WSX64507.1 aromatase/cyclase [Streptomyces sp. NBC_00986]
MAAPVIQQAEPQLVVHSGSVAAPAGLCFDLVAGVESAPQFFGSHLHAEVRRGGGRQVVERWVIAPGGGIRNWTADRFVDVTARRIVFEHAGGRPPVAGMRGEWSFTPSAGGTTEVRLEHALTFAGATTPVEVRAALADIDRGGRAQLDQLRAVAESYPRLTARTVRAEARTVVPGACTDVYERLAQAVGADHHWAAALLPGRAVVLKRVAGLSSRLHAATARIDLTQTASGVEISLCARLTSAESGPVPAALHRWLPPVAQRELALLAAAL